MATRIFTGNIHGIDGAGKLINWLGFYKNNKTYKNDSA
jgi:hypothetical protein